LQLELPDASVRLSAAGIDEQSDQELSQRLVGAILLKVDLTEFSMRFGVVRADIHSLLQRIHRAIEVAFDDVDGADRFVQIVQPHEGIERSGTLERTRRVEVLRHQAIKAAEVVVDLTCAGKGFGRFAQHSFCVPVLPGGVERIREGDPRALVARIEPYGGPEFLDAFVALVVLSISDREDSMGFSATWR
jgi:hypothetical protein